jgi:hypothetical protein
MRKDLEKIIRQKLKPIAAEVSKLFVDSMLLRINYSVIVAQDAGAEAEDVPELCQQAIDSGAEIMRLSLEKLSSVNETIEWNKAHRGN